MRRRRCGVAGGWQGRNEVILPAVAQVVRLATCLLNDSLVYTDACVTQPPEMLAAGALELAARLAHSPLPQPERGGSSCWEVLGVGDEGVAAACGVLQSMLAAAQQG